ncbi:dienelactone hydrolase family protein [Acidisphaera sp. L21]|uniref:dienelactone hydrolase family protein n=1 Tax=Acidisphaera sp. L21 TaxID=1641851 RepID=UPI00131C2E8F|nr:hypothetical protein [Acidisphaera sp. L21]
MTLAVLRIAPGLPGKKFIRRVALALGGIALLGGAGPVTRSLAIPARDGAPAHEVRVLLWQATTPGPHPLLVYQPSWGGRADENSRMAAMLAQAGFTVAAVDYATEQPSGFASQMQRMQVALDLSSDAAVARTTAEGDWRAVLMASDSSVVMDLLPAALQAPAAGIFGWSFGGAVAVEACRQDHRFKACLNMDGWMFGPAADDPSPQPYLVMSGDPYPATDEPAHDPAGELDRRDGARLRARFAAVGGSYAQLDGLQHTGFSDAGNNPAVGALVEAFFAHALMGAPEPAESPAGVTWHRVAGPAG